MIFYWEDSFKSIDYSWSIVRKMLPWGGPMSKSFVVLAVSWVASVDSVAEFWSWNESWVIFTKFFRSRTSAESSLNIKKQTRRNIYYFEDNSKTQILIFEIIELFSNIIQAWKLNSIAYWIESLVNKSIHQATLLCSDTSQFGILSQNDHFLKSMECLVV